MTVALVALSRQPGRFVMMLKGHGGDLDYPRGQWAFAADLLQLIADAMAVDGFHRRAAEISTFLSHVYRQSIKLRLHEIGIEAEIRSAYPTHQRGSGFGRKAVELCLELTVERFC